MSKSFAHTLPENMQLTPTTKLLKSLSGQILPSERIFHLIPIRVDETKVYLSFYVFYFLGVQSFDWASNRDISI